MTQELLPKGNFFSRGEKDVNGNHEFKVQSTESRHGQSQKSLQDGAYRLKTLSKAIEVQSKEKGVFPTMTICTGSMM